MRRTGGWFVSFLVLWIGLVLSGSVMAQNVAPPLPPGVGQMAEPDWVIEAAIPEPDPKGGAYRANGIDSLLTDHQIAWEGGVRLTYYRSVTQAASRAGLELMGQILLGFDPATDEIALTRLLVLRGDQVIDWTGRLTPEIYRREEELEAGMVTGHLIAHYDIPDLRVGDRVDLAFLRRRAPLLPEEQFSGTAILGGDIPLGLSRLVLNWPAERPFFHQEVRPQRMKYHEEALPGLRRMIWTLQQAVPFERERDVPVGLPVLPQVAFGTQDSWAALVANLGPAYAKDEALPAEWEAKVAAIRAQQLPPAEQAYAALRRVQEDIRYVGDEIGAGGFFARPPMLVTARGFGDCKDKALLLTTMLKRLGIPATVALADLDAGHHLDRVLPGSLVFNHMIVGAELGGSWVWMDPTQSEQAGGAQTAVIPDLGFVLPLSHLPPELVKIVPAPRGRAQILVTQRHAFELGGVNLEVTTRFMGAAADQQRHRWAVTPLHDIAAQFLRYYDGYYPGIVEQAPPDYADDPGGNVITLHEHYWISPSALGAEDLWANYPFVAEDPAENFPKPAKSPRHYPLALPDPVTWWQTIEVVNAPVNLSAPEHSAVSNAAFSASFKAKQLDHGGLRLEWFYNQPQREVAPRATRAVFEDLTALRADLFWTWDLRQQDAEPDPEAGKLNLPSDLPGAGDSLSPAPVLLP
jgi:hypothetical protein